MLLRLRSKESLMKRIALMLVAAMLVLMTGCGKSGDVYAEPTGMKVITDIPGISFAIPGMVAQATAITSISDNMEFPRNTTFAYKDGVSKYILFNMENIVILVEKGTNFGFYNFSDEEKVNGLSQSPIIGTWMTQDGKKFTFSEAADDTSYKTIADVVAGVTITTDIFDDFKGKLAVISDGTTEYAMFIGAPISIYDSIGKDGEDMIDLAAKSLKLHNSAQAPVEYDYVDGDPAEEVLEEEPLVEEATPEEAVSEETTQEEQTVEEVAEEVVVEETEETVEPVAEETTPEETAEVVEEQIVEETFDEEVMEPVDESAGLAGLGLSNQRKISRPNMFSESDIYTALNVTEGGILDAMLANDQKAEMKVNITSVYTGKEVNDILAEYGATEGSLYGPWPAPTGCRWDAIEYDIEGDPEAYVNIKLRGLDGDTLYWNGIGYSKVTFDLDHKMSNDGGKRTGMICYYPVPANCYDYMLEIGEGTISNDYRSAYYRITDKDIMTETERRELEKQEQEQLAQSIADMILGEENEEGGSN